jgi:hypothetical protein
VCDRVWGTGGTGSVITVCECVWGTGGTGSVIKELVCLGYGWPVMLSMLLCLGHIGFCEGYYSGSVFGVQGYFEGYQSV